MHDVSLCVEDFLSGEGIAADVSDYKVESQWHMVFKLRGHEDTSQADQVQVLEGQEIGSGGELSKAVDE
jgi:hypothetical protein